MMALYCHIIYLSIESWHLNRIWVFHIFLGKHLQILKEFLACHSTSLAKILSF